MKTGASSPHLESDDITYAPKFYLCEVAMAYIFILLYVYYQFLSLPSLLYKKMGVDIQHNPHLTQVYLLSRKTNY